MHFEGIEHTFASNDDLSWTFFSWKCTDKCSNLFCCLPFGELAQSFLPRPDACMDYLQEQLSGSWIEYKDSTVYWFSGEISFERLVNRYSVDIGIIHEPDYLIVEQISVVLRIQVGLGRFG